MQEGRRRHESRCFIAPSLRRAAVCAAPLETLHFEGTLWGLRRVRWRWARCVFAVFCAPRREPGFVRFVVDPETRWRIAAARRSWQGIPNAVIGNLTRERLGTAGGPKVAILHGGDGDAFSLARAIDTHGNRLVRWFGAAVLVALLCFFCAALRVFCVKRLELRFDVDVGALATLPATTARRLTRDPALLIRGTGVHLRYRGLGHNGLARAAIVLATAAQHQHQHSAPDRSFHP